MDQHTYLIASSIFEPNILLAQHKNFWSSTIDNIGIFQDSWERKTDTSSVFVIFTLSCSGKFCGVAKMESNAVFDPLPEWFQQRKKYSLAFKLTWIYKDIQVHIPDDIYVIDGRKLNPIQGEEILNQFKKQEERRKFYTEKRKLVNNTPSSVKKRKISM